MAALTRTITELVADLRYVADVEGMTDRHTTANLERAINQGWRRVVEILNDSGSGGDLTTAAGNCVAGTATLTLATDTVWLYGVDITVSGVTHSLQEHPFIDRNEFETWTNTTGEGIPATFCRDQAGKITLVPTPDDTYAYTVHYLAHPGTLTGANTVDGINGWEELAVLDAALRVLTRDDDDEQFQKVYILHQDLERRIRTAARKRTRVSPGRRIDTRGMRGRQAWIARSTYRAP